LENSSRPHRYLIPFDTSDVPHIFTDVLVIGSGVAGLRAAIGAAEYGEVLVLSKDTVREGSTGHAQGGVAVAMNGAQSVQSHIDDTLDVGCGLCDESVVRTIISEGPERVQELIRWGATFDAEDGELLFAREGGHTRRRIVHARGDATGAEIEATLVAEAQVHRNIHILEHSCVIDLISEDGVCHGAVFQHSTKGMMMAWSRQTILASGGTGRIFRETTNPPVVTGDGIAMAFRAGAKLMDLEFVQFHPTTLYIAGASRALISEAVRGEGGALVNKNGERFMTKYHPDAELAPRDIVSRNILQEMKRTADTNVYLDLTHIGRETLAKRFPMIMGLCAEFDIDIAQDLIPVRPSAHYTVGGIATDLHGQTNIEGLYACGEVACTGFHGANRLGSNSLLEGLVMGMRTGEAAGNFLHRLSKSFGPRHIKYPAERGHQSDIDISDVEISLRSLMWRNVGIERHKDTLDAAAERLEFWQTYVMEHTFDNPAGWQLQNMLTLARAIVRLAQARSETRGCHYRSDYPDRDDTYWQKHSFIDRNTQEMTGV
jgi:L-aspartate oxidase